MTTITLAIAGTAFGSLILFGIIFCLVIRLFVNYIVMICWATEQTLDYSLAYVSITSLGFPFYMPATGGSHLIRADGKPTYSMFAALSGAIINTILDPLFIFVFGWGIDGVTFAEPIADGAAGILAVVMIFLEFKKMKNLPETT